jgi:hypothetical protein
MQMKNDSKRYKLLSSLAFVVIGMFFSASVAGAFFHPSSSLERISDTGEVKISARYLAHESDLKDETTFRINLSTETDDVSSYDLQELSYISVDDDPLVQAVDWVSTGDERHIQGTLRFTGHNLHGARQVRLIVKGIGTSDDRVFKWIAE